MSVWTSIFAPLWCHVCGETTPHAQVDIYLMWGILHVADPAMSAGVGDWLGVGLSALDVAVKRKRDGEEYRVLGAWECAQCFGEHRWAIVGLRPKGDVDCMVSTVCSVPVGIDAFNRVHAVDAHIVHAFCGQAGGVDRMGEKLAGGERPQGWK